MTNQKDFRGKVTTFVVALVAIVAGILSASHIVQLGLEALPPEHDWQAWLTPIPIDGALLLASLSLAEARRQKRKAGVVVWTTLFTGVVGSIAANLAAAPPTLTGQLLAVSAPIALALSVEILLSRRNEPVSAPEISSEPLSPTGGSEDTGQVISTPENRSESPNGVQSRRKPRKTSAPSAPEAQPARSNTAEANRVIAEAYASRGVIPNRATVRQDHKVGASRADAIIALARGMVSEATEARPDLIAV